MSLPTLLLGKESVMTIFVDGYCTVKDARNEGLEEAIARATGLAIPTIKAKLRDAHGATKLRNLFTQWQCGQAHTRAEFSLCQPGEVRHSRRFGSSARSPCRTGTRFSGRRTRTTDVLINVKMLTEGTDVPSVKSVFLTRQTTSSILLTQMIGRALRGPMFGGTEDAHIVSFIDNWKQVIAFADYESLPVGQADDATPEYGKRPPLQLISIELVRRLARQMYKGGGVASPFLTLLPVGWYRIEYQAYSGEGDDAIWQRHLVIGPEEDPRCFSPWGRAGTLSWGRRCT
jgi:hypothetical protein